MKLISWNVNGLRANITKGFEKFFKEEDDMGFNEVIYKRQQKLEALRERLKKYYLSEKEIDKLFEIIVFVILLF